jgi:hypothetical protein
MTVERFTKRAGSDVHEAVEDPAMAILGDLVPDWVTLPPNLGGRRLRVLRAEEAPCPLHAHKVRHLHLEDAMSVAECPEGGFLWYRREAV